MKQMPATIKSCFRSKLSLGKAGEVEASYADYDINEGFSEMDINISTSKRDLNKATQKQPSCLISPPYEEDIISINYKETFPSLDTMSSCSSSSQSVEREDVEVQKLSSIAANIDETSSDEYERKTSLSKSVTREFADDVDSSESNDFLSPSSVFESKRLLSRTSSSEVPETRCVEKKQLCRKISEGSYFNHNQLKHNTNRKHLFTNLRKQSDVSAIRRTRERSISAYVPPNKHELIRSSRLPSPKNEQTSPKNDFSKSRSTSQLRRSISLPAANPVSKQNSESLFKRIGSLKRKKEPLDSGMLFPTEKDARQHLLAKERGRRGAVISLEINQTVSYVKTNNQDDTYCQFNFLPTKSVAVELNN